MGGTIPGILVACEHHPLLRQMAVVAAKEKILPVYLVGGFLRDAILERPRALDIDLVSVDPLSLGAALQEKFTAKVICFANDVRRVVFRWGEERVQVDIAPVRRGTIIEDLQSRDFTINAVAVSLGEEPPRLIDPTGGLRDLAEGRIRVRDPDLLMEDPLRLLRAIRLAAQLDFVIDGTTVQAIRQQASLVSQIAAERLREEFFKILECPEAGHWLSLMDDLTLLGALLPEAEAMRGCLQGPPHRFDVLTHSLETVRALDRIFQALPKILPLEAASLNGLLRAEVEGGISRRALLRFTALLHDVGKPDCRSTEDGQVRFLGHAERGAGLVREISRRLRLGSRASAITVALVREHLRPLFLRQAKPITPRARYRFWRDLGDLSADLLLLSLADAQATWAGKERAFGGHLRFVREMFAFHRQRMTATGAARLLTGNELMARFDLSPGPFLGFLLERIREEASIGSLTTTEEALEYLKWHLPELHEEFARMESP